MESVGDLIKKLIVLGGAVKGSFGESIIKTMRINLETVRTALETAWAEAVQSSEVRTVGDGLLTHEFSFLLTLHLLC